MFPHDAVGTERRQQFKLRRPRRGGAAVRQIDDLALYRTVDRTVRRIDETAEVLGMPVVAPRLAGVAVHPLLHHRPGAVVGHEESVQIEIEAVLHGSAVHLRHQAAHRGESLPVESDALAQLGQFLRRSARMFPASAADMDTEFPAERRQTALERPDHAGGDAGNQCQSIPITAPNA